MIEQLYLDLTEETKDQMIYGKLLQACQTAAEDLSRVDRVNEIQWNLRERMRVRLIERLFDWF